MSIVKQVIPTYINCSGPLISNAPLQNVFTEMINEITNEKG